MTRGEQNIAWIEQHCKVPEGKFVGQPVRLAPFQREIVLGIYDTPTRRAIISFAKKNAKTSLSAFLLLLHLCGPEARRNSQLYSAAQSREQAAVLFGLAAKVVRMSADLSAYVIVRDAAKQLACAELGTVYKAMSADASTAHGGSSAFVVHDELGQVKGPVSDLYEALESAAAAHDDPLSIVISTQAPTDGDLLSLLIDDALTGADPLTKVWVYSAPMGLPLSSIEAIRAANPGFDHFMNRDELLTRAADAERMPSKESSFRNLNLNQRVATRSPFVSKSVWDANSAAPAGDWPLPTRRRRSRGRTCCPCRGAGRAAARCRKRRARLLLRRVVACRHDSAWVRIRTRGRAIVRTDFGRHLGGYPLW